jgi:hypothetical protein
MDFSQIILIFIMAVVLVYLAFWFYGYYKDRTVVYRQSEVLVDGQHDATKSVIVDNSKIPLSAQGNEYTISFWIYIKDYNYRFGNNKTILHRGDKENKESNPFIYLHSDNNDMTIKVQLQTNTVMNNDLNNTDPLDNKSNNKEEFRTVLPMGYFRQNNNDKEKHSNISGNEIEGFEDSVSMEENNGIVPATPETATNPEPVNNEESLTGLDGRLDKVELQIQKLIGMKADESSAKEGTQENTQEGQVDSTTQVMPITYDECVVKNLPLQRWTHVAISMFNNHVEVYLDGKLNKTCSLKGFPKPNLQNMYVCANGGFDGYLANLEYSNMAITQDEVYADYVKGPKLMKGLWDKIKGAFGSITGLFKNN